MASGKEMSLLLEELAKFQKVAEDSEVRWAALEKKAKVRLADMEKEDKVRLAAMEKRAKEARVSDKRMRGEWKEIKKEARGLSKEVKKLQCLAKHSSAKELVICAQEVSKWAAGKRRVAVDDGRQLYNTSEKVQEYVGRAAKAMCMSSKREDMQAMSRICILARNDTAHFQSIQVLDDAVLSSHKAVQIFPQLKRAYPEQWKTIRNYERLKEELPENFM